MNRVTVGQPINNSFRRENEIIDAVNKLNIVPLVDGKSTDFNNSAVGIIQIENNTSENLFQGSAVFINNLLTVANQIIRNGNPVYGASFEKSGIAIVAIAKQLIKPGKIGIACVSGAVFLRGLPETFEETHTHVSINTDGTLSSGNSGDIRLLGVTEEKATAEETAKKVAIALLGSSVGGVDGYKGYFMLTTAPVDPESEESEDNPKQLYVVDGATWDGKTSGTSTCVVNGYVFNVEMADFTMPTQTKYVILKMTADETLMPAKIGTLSIELMDRMPSFSFDAAYAQVGRVIVDPKTKVATLQQDHTTGVVYLWWYGFCVLPVKG